MENKELALLAKNNCRLLEQELDNILYGPTLRALNHQLEQLSNQYTGSNEEIKHLADYLNGCVEYSIKESKESLQNLVFNRLNNL